jgi:nitrite reductase/ring-hydroxylating ferredoxin subunit
MFMPQLLILYTRKEVCHSSKMTESDFIEVAKLDEVPAGNMKHIELNRKEILIVNLADKIYALNDRCSHTNAPLSMGYIQDNIITCPMHGARFDITTGKKVSDPKMPSFNIDSLPVNMLKYMEYAGQLLSRIKTYDQDSYEVRVEGNSIKIKV